MTYSVEISPDVQDLLEDLISYAEKGKAPEDWMADKLRALLAAPVVERQPVYQVKNTMRDNGWRDVTKCRFDASQNPCWNSRTLYTAPPELAELQATISQLTAENERLRKSDEEATELCDTLSSLLGQIAVAVRGPEEPKSRHGFHDLPSRVKTVVSEIERLKGGQGKPAAPDPMFEAAVSKYTFMDTSEFVNGCYHGSDETQAAWEIWQMRSATPAPVSVVLDERAAFELSNPVPEGVTWDDEAEAYLSMLYPDQPNAEYPDLWLGWKMRAGINKVATQIADH